MRFLANENVPGPVVRALRDLGHDVLWAKEDHTTGDNPIGAIGDTVGALLRASSRVVSDCHVDLLLAMDGDGWLRPLTRRYSRRRAVTTVHVLLSLWHVSNGGIPLATDANTRL